MRDAIAAAGGDPSAFAGEARRRDELLGYVELHIEQGPVLESLDGHVGVVSAIAGRTRARLELIGRAGHAGTVPMALRHDPLVVAARIVERVDAIARGGRGRRRDRGRADGRARRRERDPRPRDAQHRRARARRRCAARRPGRRSAIASTGSRRRAASRRARSSSSTRPPSRATRGCAPCSRAPRARAGSTRPTLMSGAGHDAVDPLRDRAGRDAVRALARRRQPPSRTRRVREQDVAVALDVLEEFVRALALAEGGAMTYDLVIRGGTLVTPDGVATGDLGIDGRRDPRARATSCPAGTTRSTRAACSCCPGAVDAHVHLNDPGRADWEGIATGTAALAAGGSTTAIDMPLNAHPPTVDAAAFDLKAARIAESAARRPRALGRARARQRRAAGGARRARASSASRRSCARAASTTSRRPTATRCWEGMLEAARLGLPVAVHAESRGADADADARGPSRRTARRCATSSTPGRSRPSSRRSSRPSSSRSATRLLAARRARLERARRRAGRRGPGARRRRHLRDVPALPRADRGGRRAARRRREVRAAPASRRGASTRSGRRSRRASCRWSRPTTPPPRPSSSVGQRVPRSGAASRAPRRCWR